MNETNITPAASLDELKSADPSRWYHITHLVSAGPPTAPGEPESGDYWTITFQPGNGETCSIPADRVKTLREAVDLTLAALKPAL